MIYKIVALAVLALIIFIVWYRYFYNPMTDVLKMGHMRYWWIFGFEPWGLMPPDSMQRRDGTVYKSLFWGIWIKTKDPKYTERYDPIQGDEK